jgi:hypothetical protein
VLLVIALLGLFSTLFVLNADALLNQAPIQAVETKFWVAVREARAQAILQRRAHAMRFDRKAGAFVIENVFTGAERRFVVNREDWPEEMEFSVALKKRVDPGQHRLVAGELVTLRDIPAVRFFPDGACTPFVAVLQVGDAEEEIEIDPWTGAELLKSKDEQ